MQNLKKTPLTSTSSPNHNGSDDGIDESVKAFGVSIAPMPAAQKLAEHAGPHTAPDAAHRPYKIDRDRYNRIVIFFGMLFARTLLWEVVLRRVLGNRFVARRRPNRYRTDSRGFRRLAVEMGGVLIKLGQFVSSRVDVLPPEITEELEGLQDQVPVVDFGYIKTTIERELGPIEERFVWLNAEPVAAASFGQVHRAQLPNGDRVVIKVQRPAINNIVHTDLAALSVVARLSMRFGFIARRANVPELLEEFSRVLWEELDYLAEADHALTFASMFRNDPGIYVPAVYLDYTTALVLTLEDVTSIKLNDYAAIEQAGVDRREVASRLLACYLHQIFDMRFFHADPHPGNLFVYPLPLDKASENGATPTKRPFYLIFIDFGMVGRLTPQLQEGLRETLIAVATQDAKALVASYNKLGVLLPGTDTKRVEDATRAVFDKVWGLNMTEMANMPFEEMTALAKEFSDLLLSMPFQMPQDFIYLSRAVGILSGMCTGLDPTFDPWREMQPFTQTLLDSSSARTKSAVGGLTASDPRAALGITSQLVREFGLRLYKLPALADNVLTRAERGDLQVRMTPDESLKKQITRIETATSQIAIGVIFGTLTLASTLLYVNHEQGLGFAGYVLSGISLLVLLMRGRE
jgi:predicted unusual protein kinase regulating ubiquinone biosynthesis (AarF/ABC1/UbiB family)